MKRLLLAGLIVVMLSPAALAEDLQLTSGTMTLGGVASFSIDMTMPDQGDGETGFTLALIPEVGYFVIDNLEVVGRVNLAMWFGDLYTIDVGGQEIDMFPKMIGFDLGAKYYIPMGSIVPYAGLMVGMNFSIPDSELDEDTTKRFDLTVPLGILMPLNSHVALDLGVAIIYKMSLEDNGGSTLNVPIGYFGVQGFF